MGRWDRRKTGTLNMAALVVLSVGAGYLFSLGATGDSTGTAKIIAAALGGTSLMAPVSSARQVPVSCGRVP